MNKGSEMKNKTKRIITMAISFMLMLVMTINYSHSTSRAAGISLTMYVSAGEVNVGDTVEVTVSASCDEYFSCDINVNYDSSILEFVSSSFGNGTLINISGTSGSATITFRAIAAGDVYVSTSSDGYLISGESAEVYDQGAGISVVDPSATTTEATTEETTETTTESTTEATSETTSETTTEETTETTSETTSEEDLSDNCNLLSLSIDPGTLAPEFSAYETEYEVVLDEGTTRMNVTAVAEDEKAEVSVSGNEELSNGENTVRISVTAENGAYKTYYLYVTVGDESGDPVVKIDGKTYKILDDISIDAPEGFTETTAKYDKWNVKAYQSLGKKIKLICVLKDDEVDEDGKTRSVEQWYYVDEKSGYLKKYQEYPSEKQRYMIIDYPMTSSFMLPAFSEAELSIGSEKYKAYVSDADKNIYLIYAIPVDGDEGYYLYDDKEKSIMRYVDIQPTTEITTETTTEATTEKVKTIVIDNTKKVEDKGFFSKKNLKMMLIGMTVMFLILCVALIALVIRLSNVQRKSDKAVSRKAVRKNDDIEFDEDNVEEYEKDTDEFFDNPEKVYNDAQTSKYYADSEETDDSAAGNYSDSAEQDFDDFYNNDVKNDVVENDTYEEVNNTDDLSGEVQNNEDYAQNEYSGEDYSEEEYIDDAVTETDEADQADYEETQAVAEEYSETEYAEEYADEPAEQQYEETSAQEYNDIQNDEAFDDDTESYAEYTYIDETYTENAYDAETTVRNDGRYNSVEATYGIPEESYIPTSSIPTPVKKYDGGVTGKIEISDVIEASEVTASGMMAYEKPSKVSDDTIGIQLEDAIDNNSNVNVPPVSELSSREEAMKTRPYGIDSAFDVIEEDKYREMASAAEENTTDISEVINNTQNTVTSGNMFRPTMQTAAQPVSRPQVMPEEKKVVADPTVSAAAAAFANIRKTVEESAEETVQKVSDDDIVFPTGIDK